jgi:hypothetical protein
MLDNIFGELLKHRRALIRELNTLKGRALEAAEEELQKTDILQEEIQKVVAELKAKIVG